MMQASFTPVNCAINVISIQSYSELNMSTTEVAIRLSVLYVQSINIDLTLQ
jgi:hypothetical protein